MTAHAITRCQVCGATGLHKVLSLGYMPPVNQMVDAGSQQQAMPWFPTTLYLCQQCELVQLGIVVDKTITFPPGYPYTSGMTKLLRDNFEELYAEASLMLRLTPEDLCVDIGSNDGTLLSNFSRGGHRVLGVEPTDVAKIAAANGIQTMQSYFGLEAAVSIKENFGQAKLVTAANCFAHIEDVHYVTENIIELLTHDGVFISESHYLFKLLEFIQYDTIYHEHLRYYSVTSLKHLFAMHGLEIIHAKHIPTHGGSIRVYAAHKGAYPVRPSVQLMLDTELTDGDLRFALDEFSQEVLFSKLQLNALLLDLKKLGWSIVGIGAPSRASTLVNYTGLDESIIDYVCEMEGSLKIGKYMPGTMIPVVDESRLFTDQPECAVIFSWHIADELVAKLRAKGYAGKLITPLPTPKMLA